ncbi:Cell wall endopeptidase, family M23/M37 [Candidatus Sumerlaea chitinivorans]|uniref:Cell wall endopeptidase, family M23/M37 n=1 Tax=Sumerlaea chitinivorans TaxID=2250252 RepID=A0A2Z4Y1P2_SUMC1|nr:Cell wall endopeptidase, family M23/M37 [Candidatus Sumerlaea chitinivorans]
MRHWTRRIGFLLIYFGVAGSGFSAPASSPPPIGWPMSSPNSFPMTAAFDLDSAVGGRADWTGWVLGEPTAGSGHAYDEHSGTDFGMVTGTSLYAVANGTVYALRESVPNDDHSDTGNYLILNHPGIAGRDYRTRYWHLAQNGVIPSSGDSVTKGQLVAYSDNTGNSTGPHLHFGISLLPSDKLTCPFYHGWWENDEFYYGDGYPCLIYLTVNTGPANVREGNSTSYPIITQVPAGARLVATQRNSWYRVMLPMPPAVARESRTPTGALASGYTETGTWADLADKSTVADSASDANRVTLSGLGSRASGFTTVGDSGDVATFAFNAPNQRGYYDIYATWPASANAANVTYRVTDSNGVTSVVVQQVGFFGSSGNGTKTNPYRITTNPYVANHTTVGAPSEWASYSPAGSGISEGGPENLYRFDLLTTSTVFVQVQHSGYPTLDVDIHLLSAPSNTACLQRADWSFTSSELAPGTYYISVDTYQNASRATAYTLTVRFQESTPFPNSWVKLGTFFYDRNAAGSVQILESTVTGKLEPSAPGTVVADAIKIVPRVYRRTGWISNTLVSRIDTGATPVGSVGIRVDATTNYDSDALSDYVEVPIYASPSGTTSNSSAIVGKAVTGQRFVCTGRNGDWYRVELSLGTDSVQGWILGDHLFGYHLDAVSSVEDWSLY